MAILFKCKMCGGALDIAEGASTVECPYCGTQQTLPRLDDDRRNNLYDRANHFRRNNEYDKALAIYEQILNEEKTDAEAYWSIVLCRYGIEYVEDPKSHKRVPTVNRAQYTSIFADEDYKSALQYADAHQKTIYEAEAKAIDEIQKGILEISKNEKPFDVFICYKESDNSGRRTQDSVLANDLYHQLTQEGFKVFFSRITLEDKLGVAYEPYIFAALNSAKVMVAIGTKPEYFNAVWVKNEWSRYLALVKQSGGKKALIPAYRDMDPYDLPEEFSHLQAQDMSKLGFMQDLIRGIKKLVEDEEPRVQKETVVRGESGGSAEPLLKRAFMYLEDGDWNNANTYCERILDIDPENGKAYLGKLMAELKCRKSDDLKEHDMPFDNLSNYEKAIRFCKLQEADSLKAASNNVYYNTGIVQMESATTEEAFLSAADTFRYIKSFQDAEEKAEKCVELAEAARKDGIYSEAVAKSGSDNIETIGLAIKTFEQIEDWKDAAEQIDNCKRKIAEINRAAEEKATAAKKRKKLIAMASGIVAIAVVLILVVTQVIIPGVEQKKLEKIGESCRQENGLTIIKYGKYEYRVLEMQGSKALLIAEDCVIEKPYNEEDETTTWSVCTLRKWLNGDFYNSAFSEEQKNNIAATKVENKDNPEYGTYGGQDTEDKIFLLSIDEVNKYFKNDEDRIAEYDGEADWWWLRSPGDFSSYAAFVFNDGSVYEDGYRVYDYYGVRPALWLNLEP